MTPGEQIEHLTAQLRQVLEQLQAAQEELRKAQERIAELEKRNTPTSSLVKANAKKRSGEDKQPRKKREAQYNRARRRATPTQIVEHRIVACPDCLCAWEASVWLACRRSSICRLRLASKSPNTGFTRDGVQAVGAA